MKKLCCTVCCQVVVDPSFLKVNEKYENYHLVNNFVISGPLKLVQYDLSACVRCVYVLNETLCIVLYIMYSIISDAHRDIPGDAEHS